MWTTAARMAKRLLRPCHSVKRVSLHVIVYRKALALLLFVTPKKRAAYFELTACAWITVHMSLLVTSQRTVFLLLFGSQSLVEELMLVVLCLGTFWHLVWLSGALYIPFV